MRGGWGARGNGELWGEASEDRVGGKGECRAGGCDLEM